MQAQDLESVIRANVEGVKTLIVNDVSGGCGQAFDVIIVSTVFEGLPTLKRHRLVNDRLKNEIAQLHAFSQKTYTPAQYEALSSGTATPTATQAAAPSSAPAAAMSTNNEATAASAAAAANTSPAGLAAPFTPPTKSSTRGTGSSHNRTASNVSIPELTLTTDKDTLSGRAASGAPHPLSPGVQPGGTTQHLPQMHSSPSSSTPSSSVSRLHHSKVASVDFWEGLRAYLESQLIADEDPEAMTAGAPLASPGGNRGSSSSKGEAELHRLWEDFFQSQKPHLSASDVAKVRDGVGMFGWV